MSINDALQVLLGLFSNTTLIGMVLALVGGWLFKKFPGLDNRLIPIFTFIVALGTQVLNFLVGTPPSPETVPHAPADSTIGMAGATYMTAGFFDGSFFKTVMAAVLQWLVTDKFYDAQKKAINGAKEVVDDVPMSKSAVSPHKHR